MSKTDVVTYAQIAFAAVILLLFAYNMIVNNGGMSLDGLLHLLIGLGIASGAGRAEMKGS